MATQLAHERHARFDGRPQVRRATDELRVVEVVRADAHPDEPFEERPHRRCVVVDAGEEHGLVADRDAGLGEARARLGRLARELSGAVEVGVEPQRDARAGRVQDGAQRVRARFLPYSRPEASERYSAGA